MCHCNNIEQIYFEIFNLYEMTSSQQGLMLHQDGTRKTLCSCTTSDCTVIFRNQTIQLVQVHNKKSQPAYLIENNKDQEEILCLWTNVTHWTFRVQV